METLNVSKSYLNLLAKFKIVDDLSELSILFKEASELLNLDRIILHEKCDEKKVRVISVFDSSNIEEDRIKLDSYRNINENENLKNTFLTGTISKIPVEGIGEDIAIPINNNYILTADDINEARETTEMDNTLLSFIASSITNIIKIRNLIIKNSTDALTNSLNRGALDVHIEEGIDPFEKKFKKSSGIIFIDIDHFGVFNKVHGHAAGDIVLKDVFTILKYVVGEKGRVYRYGGEEIVIIYFDSDIEKMSETLRLLVEKKVVHFEEKSLSVKISSGVAKGSNIKDSITKANHSLIHAKETGRNKVTVYNSKIKEWFENHSEE